MKILLAPKEAATIFFVSSLALTPCHAYDLRFTSKSGAQGKPYARAAEIGVLGH